MSVCRRKTTTLLRIIYLPPHLYNTSVFDIIILPYTSPPEYSSIYLPIINIRYFQYRATTTPTPPDYLHTFSIFCQKSIHQSVCNVHYMVGEFVACIQARQNTLFANFIISILMYVQITMISISQGAVTFSTPYICQPIVYILQQPFAESFQVQLSTFTKRV